MHMKRNGGDNMALKTYTEKQVKKMKDKTDWDRIKNMSDTDIDFSDIPMATPEMMSKATLYSYGKPVKENINLPLDTEIISFFKSMGKDWQTKINDVLLQVVRLRKTN